MYLYSDLQGSPQRHVIKKRNRAKQRPMKLCPSLQVNFTTSLPRSLFHSRISVGIDRTETWQPF